MGTAGNKLFSANSTTSMAGIQLKKIFNKDIRISCAGDSAKGNTCKRGIKINEILNKNIMICSHTHGGKSSTDNMSVPHIKLNEILNDENSEVNFNDTQLDKIFKEKYRDQFEIDFENKILYRTVKAYKNFPRSIIDIKYKNDAGKKYKKHPTTKPVEVLEFLLHHYTEENDLVLDMTAGSGSTAVACKKMNRNFVGSEISKVWFDVAQQRINDI